MKNSFLISVIIILIFRAMKNFPGLNFHQSLCNNFTILTLIPTDYEPEKNILNCLGNADIYKR
jgi:hypothetical protein